MRIRRRIRLVIQNGSFLDLVTSFLFYPKRKYKQIMNDRVVVSAGGLEERFSEIYRRNAWGSSESASGSGSTLDMTSSIRSLLPELFSKYEIASIFDAPCGDFNWMREVDLNGISYIGGDIVEHLVDDLNSKFSSKTIVFVHTDITIDSFPKSDLVLNRDCLFHLSYEDISLTLNNFLNSGGEVLLNYFV